VDIINGALGTPVIGLIFANLGAIVLVIIASVILSIFTKFPNALECAVNVVRHVSNIVNAAARKYDLRAKK
jgi:Na+-driven multidrug efflux pump